MRVPSSGGVQVAVHELGGAGTPLLVAHATGFHGPVYQQLADGLADVARTVALDFRGHGDTQLPMGEPGDTIDWERYGDDALAVATWLADQAGEPIVAFGHSMGGACLLMAARRNPRIFRRLVTFEPIVFPPVVTVDDANESVMVTAAKRRRAWFLSFDDAIANYASKPPLNAFTPEALGAYVRHGFALQLDGTVHLKCTPQVEAATFAGGGLHHTWDHLPEIDTDVLVVSGRPDDMPPSQIANQIAERLPNGRHLLRTDMDHFGPMTHPHDVAAIIRDQIG